MSSPPSVSNREPALVALTTDFGAASPYVAQMKAAVLEVNCHASLVDITHAIRPQDISQAALVLADSAPYFPVGTTHLVVVDPGVGTERGIVAATIDGRAYVAPDNGLLSGVLSMASACRMVRVTNSHYWRRSVSSTFHGRDIMGPVAGHLSLGIPLEEFGDPLKAIHRIPWATATVQSDGVCGQVLMVDTFGNLITSIRSEDLAALDDSGSATVVCAETAIRGLVRTYGQRPVGTCAALIGSTGRLEIAVVQGNASQILGVGVGEPVRVF